MATNRKFLRTGLAVSALIMAAMTPALAVDIRAKNTGTAVKDESGVASIVGIDFGDDGSVWANDGECDDPRFQGPGTAVELIGEDLGRDATDCSTLYAAGEIILVPDPADIVGEINFGDNSSEWANDQECDDPRFDGAGVDDILLAEDMARDANDCRTLFLSGDVIYLGDDPTMEFVNFDGIDFGNNTSEWANDIECDDPRFTGTGMADVLVNDDLGKDANDCLTLYQNGDIVLAGDNVIPDTSVDLNIAGIDFGDDTSAYAKDNECDDPRFQGPGSASLLLEEDLGRDATDCAALFASGQITLIASDTTVATAGIDFGDDSSEWSNDGECDDPRFKGPGSAEVLLDQDLGRDASDCETLYQTGQISLASDGDTTLATAGIDFGDDSSNWSNDLECDDPRFIGLGTAAKLLLEDLKGDATDCQALFDAGSISLITNTNFDFGDDSSRWNNDGECDDPRFRGEGMAAKLQARDIAGDATDCQILFDSGQLEFIGGIGVLVSINDNGNNIVGAIDFGDDTSQWANDQECDDPRFAGTGVSGILLEDDLGRDATDCRELFQAGQIYLINEDEIEATLGIDFGDNTSDYANDQECDDPRFAGPGSASVLLDDDLGRDAADCRALYVDGQVSLLSELLIDFGDDTSDYANDNQCDDPRFGGTGVAQVLLVEDLGRDATDCRAAFEAGQIYLEADGEINFGDNTSDYANDNECDDPRFAGPGSASSPLAENNGRDATDCQFLYQYSQIFLI